MGFTVLAPLGLLALGAILIPLAIHLFSRSRGQQVAVGWIELYRATERTFVSELRIQQWLLLMIRMLLLIAAALLVAELARSQREALEGATAYVTPAWLEQHDASDSRLDAYRQIYVLQADFPLIADYLERQAKDDARKVSSFSLLTERFSTVEHRDEVAVYALATAGEFSHRVPSLGEGVTWHLDPSPSALSTPAHSTPALSTSTQRTQEQTDTRNMSSASGGALLEVSVVHTPAFTDAAMLTVAALRAASEFRSVTVHGHQRLYSSAEGLAPIAQSGAADSATTRSPNRAVILLGVPQAELRKAVLALAANNGEYSPDTTAPLSQSFADSGPNALTMLLADASTVLAAPDIDIDIDTDTDTGDRQQVNTQWGLFLHPLQEDTLLAPYSDAGLWRGRSGSSQWLEGYFAQGEQSTRLLLYRPMPNQAEYFGLPLAAPNFPDVLVRLLLGPTHASSLFAGAQIDPEIALGQTALVASAKPQSLATLLALLIVLLFAIERVMSEPRSTLKATDNES